MISRKVSVKHLFYSSMQTIITFSAILARVVEMNSIDDLDLKPLVHLNIFKLHQLKKIMSFKLLHHLIMHN